MLYIYIYIIVFYLSVGKEWSDKRDSAGGTLCLHGPHTRITVRRTRARTHCRTRVNNTATDEPRAIPLFYRNEYLQANVIGSVHQFSVTTYQVSVICSPLSLFCLRLTPVCQRSFFHRIFIRTFVSVLSTPVV